ncbi:MAG TPA: hypothetical protein VK601_28075, partial [Kofleriaceae bacterium]|nr:hypothetical protein [Kofleriaceae bacterium]
TVGERVRVYRATRGRSRLIAELDDDTGPAADVPSAGHPRIGQDHDRVAPSDSRAPEDPDDPRDYDVEHYLRVLRDTYAARFARALAPEDFVAIFADPEQPSLFARSLHDARPILTPIAQSPPEPEPESDAEADPDPEADSRHALHR